jgi:8-oxo-dGTP diphosphatase
VLCLSRSKSSEMSCSLQLIDWAYTTFVVRVDEPFGASINFETDDVAWLPLDKVDELPLHAGFAAAWPQLKEIAPRAE